MKEKEEVLTMTTMTMTFPYFVNVFEAAMWFNLLIKMYHPELPKAVDTIGDDTLIINVESFKAITNKDARVLIGSARIARRTIREALGEKDWC